jgi:hypothetical protein
VPAVFIDGPRDRAPPQPGERDVAADAERSEDAECAARSPKPPVLAFPRTREPRNRVRAEHHPLGMNNPPTCAPEGAMTIARATTPMETNPLIHA